ncbi:WD40 repeat-like protein [Calocera cornea HHB12733]|uniref:WD40 repeat-like protein n=1 Tax=Calocera cornea HHB12733 TaxID=1353952 RepID=A0A165DP27_9BASI|nr:WD40 repeat-like protein [Calocera cornea HHB12733]
MAWQRDDPALPTQPARLASPRLSSPFLPSPGFTTSSSSSSATQSTTHAYPAPSYSHPRTSYTSYAPPTASASAYAYPTPPSAAYSLSASVTARLALAQLTPSPALLNANAPHTRYVRLRVVGQGQGCADVAARGEGGRVAVGGKDVLKIIKFTNRLPATPLPSSPSSPPTTTATASHPSSSNPLAHPQPVQRSLSDRGHSRRGKSKVVGPGGSTAEEVLNVWSGSKLSLVHGLQDVAWGHQNYSEKLVTAHVQGDCILWDLQKTGSKVETFLHEHARGRGVVRVQFSPRQSHLVLSGSIDGTCKLWDLRKPMSSVSTFRCNAAVSAVCFSPIGGSSDFVAGLGNGAIQRFDYRMGDKGMVDWVSSAHSAAVQDLKWREPGPTSTDDSGTWLASCGMDKFVKIWDMDASSPTSALSGAPGGNSYGSFASPSQGQAAAAGSYSSGTGSSLLSSSQGTASSASGSQGVPYNKPKQVLRTPTYNRRVAWRPGVDTELVVLPYVKAGGGEEAEEEEAPEEARIALWDVRRNYVPKYVFEGGTGAPRDVLFFETEPDALLATYHNSYVVQHDLRHHTRPIDALSRTALSWDGSGRMAFATEERTEGEVPFDEPPYDPLTRIRNPGGKEHTVRGPRFTPTNQVAAGMLVPGLDADAFSAMARGYVLSGGEKHELCGTNAKVAREAGHVEAAQGWQMLHSLLVPLPMPSRSPSPMHSTPGQKSSKFSYSPLSGSSRRANSSGPKSRGRRAPSGRQVARPRASRRATAAAVAAEEADKSVVSGEATQHVGEGALEDSDSEGDAGDEGEPDGSDVPISPVETKVSNDDRLPTVGGVARHHTRNQHSESSVSSGVASMRSPLSRTPVTADSIGVSGLRRLSEMTEEDEEQADASAEGPLSPDGQTDGETGNELDLESSSSAPEGGLMLKRGKPVGRSTPRQHSQLQSSQGTRRNSIESESTNANTSTSFVRGHRHTISNGSATAQSNTTGRGQLRSGKKLSASPAPVDQSDAIIKPGVRRSKREIVEAEQRIRQKGWEVMRTVYEGMLQEGDVQTCAVMGIITGDELVKEEGKVVRIVSAYLEMLSRLQLFTAAAEVRKYFQAPEVQDVTNSGTQFDSSCARCKKALRGEKLSRGSLGNAGNYAYCKDCNRAASRCAICHLPSKGLFFLCPTCGHGGHEECFKDYYLSHPMDNVHIFLQTTQVLPPHSLRGNRHSISDASQLDEEDRTGRAPNAKRLRRGPGRVHPVEAADDSEDESQKARFWERKRRIGKRVLLGHPCVAGCGHVCWVSNDRIQTDLK